MCRRQDSLHMYMIYVAFCHKRFKDRQTLPPPLPQIHFSIYLSNLNLYFYYPTNFGMAHASKLGGAELPALLGNSICGCSFNIG